MTEAEKRFKELGMNVIAFLANMDVVMQTPSTAERGKEIARLCTALEIANDRAMRFGLSMERHGVKLRKLRR